MEFYRKIKILEEVIQWVGEAGPEGEYAPEYLVEAEQRPIDGSLSMADREARACYAHVGGGQRRRRPIGRRLRAAHLDVLGEAV
jgi:hypothetical protein